MASSNQIGQVIRQVISRPFKFASRLAESITESILGVPPKQVLPHGVDPLDDLARIVPKWQPRTIFDVGANVGQSALVYAQRFPTAKIFSFEPTEGTFQQLTQNVSAYRNVECLRLALAAATGTGHMEYGENSVLNRIATGDDGKINEREEVHLQSLDDFCGDRAIQWIHYLKIDTEGNDLEVLRGAGEMLREHRIDIIDVEVGIGLDNELHVPLQQVREFLEAAHYQIFGFYDQMEEWKRRLPHLRRVNAVFISKILDQLENDEY